MPAGGIHFDSFLLNNSTGTQVVDGFGFTPGASILWHCGATTGNTTQSTWQGGIGFAVASGTSGAGSIAWRGTDNVVATIENAASDSRYCILGLEELVDDTGYQASIVSVDSDGFTLNVENAPSSGVLVNVLALDSGAISGAEVRLIQSPLSTQTVHYNAGFEPDLIYIITATTVSDPQLRAAVPLSIGFSDGNNDRCTSMSSNDAVGTSDVEADWSSTIIDSVLWTNTSFEVANVHAVSSSGYELNWTTVSPSFEVCYFALALKLGNQVQVGHSAENATVGTLTTVTTSTWTPGAVMGLTGRDASSVLNCIGAGASGISGVNEQSCAYTNQHNLGTTDTHRHHKEDHFIYTEWTDGSIIRSQLSEFTSGSFSHRVQENDFAISYPFIYLAIESGNVAAGGETAVQSIRNMSVETLLSLSVDSNIPTETLLTFAGSRNILIENTLGLSGNNDNPVESLGQQSPIHNIPIETLLRLAFIRNMVEENLLAVSGIVRELSVEGLQGIAALGSTPEEILASLSNSNNINIESLLTLAGIKQQLAIEFLQGLQALGSTPEEILASLSKNGVIPTEVIGSEEFFNVIRDCCVPIENLADLSTLNKTAALEHLQGLSPSTNLPIENLASLLLSDNMTVENLLDISLLDQMPVELLTSIADNNGSPIENLGSLSQDESIPVEIRGALIVGVIRNLPLESLQGLAPSTNMPVEDLKSLAPNIGPPIEQLLTLSSLNRNSAIEFLQGLSSSHDIPVESDGSTSVGVLSNIPIEYLSQLSLGHKSALDNMGLFTNALQTYIDNISSVFIDHSLPIELLESVTSIALQQLPIEVLAGIASQNNLPLSTLQVLASIDHNLPTEGLGSVSVFNDLPVEVRSSVAISTIKSIPIEALVYLSESEEIPLATRRLFGQFISRLNWVLIPRASDWIANDYRTNWIIENNNTWEI